MKIGTLVRTPIGRTAEIIRGPYRKYGQEYYDVVQPNDFGEPGLYSNRYLTTQLAEVAE